MFIEQEISHSQQDLSLEERREFLKLPMAERRRILSQQAARLMDHYASATEVSERELWQGGDIVEHP